MKYVTDRCAFLALVTMFVGLFGAGASAESIPHGTVELIAESQWISPGHETYLALEFELESGWHIYWVNPGDSGQPPRIEWRLPPGLTPREIEWPAPQRLGTSPIVDFGYEGSATLLVPVRVSSSVPMDETALLGADLKVLVCKDICIPGQAHVSVILPIRSAPPAPDVRDVKLFASARHSLPRRPSDSWSFIATDQGNSFVLIANLGRQVARATFFPLTESQVDNAAPQAVVPIATGCRLTLQKSDQLLKPIKRLRGVLELSPGMAYVIDAAVENSSGVR